MKTPVGHDAIKYSKSQTPVREACELWTEHVEEVRSRLQLHAKKFGTPLSREEMEQMIGVLFRIAEHLFEVIETIHWPKHDGANTHPTDERGVELAARHLSTEYMQPGAGIELAWGLIRNGLLRYREWKNNETYRSIGVNLDAYFWAEVETIMAVVEQDHLQRAAVADAVVTK